MAAAVGRVLVFVRHGETTGESSIRYYGRTDVPLSPSGRQQMLEIGQRLSQAGFAFNLVLTSSLARCREAAELIYPSVPGRALPAFDEIHFGRWEGMTEAEIRAADPQAFARWRRDPSSFTYPGGESTRAFRRRVWQSFVELLPSLPGATLFVGHKGVIRAIFLQLLKDQEPIASTARIDLGSLHVLTEGRNGWKAVLVDGSADEAESALRKLQTSKSAPICP